MGFVAIISEFFRSNGIPMIKGTAEAGTAVAATHCTPPGDDSPPLPTDYAGGTDAGGTGTFMTVGYVDRANVGIADPGEKRLYGRDANGAIVNVLYMQGDGTVSLTTAQGTVTLGANGAFALSNGAGSIALAANGTVTINGVIIDPSGNITTGGTVEASTVIADSVIAGGKQLVAHVHAVTSGAGAPGMVGPNL